MRAFSAELIFGPQRAALRDSGSTPMSERPDRVDSIRRRREKTANRRKRLIGRLGVAGDPDGASSEGGRSAIRLRREAADGWPVEL
jgi:hypothetical protein